MSTETIKAEARTEFGKGAARRIRRENKIPAVIYGHGNDPIHVTMPGHDTMMAIKHGGANALLEIEIDGKTQLALTKAVQVDPVRRVLEHVDFVTVKRGEKVTVDVPVLTVGEAARDTLVQIENNTVQIEAEATHIPESIEVDIEGVEAGTQILAGALTLPKGSTLLTDAETLMVHISEAQAADTGEESEAAEGEGDAEAGDAAAEGAEGDSE
ncbi:50S ribosomal protein L25/general stress protein Ctc [Nocardioides ultimimeridianus]